MIQNIYNTQQLDLKEEHFQDLLSNSNFRLERIVSKGHATPEGEWYDQDKNEWVILLQGKAALRFKDTDQLTILCPGDHIHIPAHQQHRVEWTSTNQKTIWMALFY